MNTDTLKGQWAKLSSKIQEKWGALTKDDLTSIDGNKNKFLGRLRELYGYTKEEAQDQLNQFAHETNLNFQDVQNEISSKLNEAKKGVDHFVQRSPLKALGIAALVGLLIGLRF